MDEMQAIYSLFLKCANNFSGDNEVALDCVISELTLANHCIHNKPQNQNFTCEIEYLVRPCFLPLSISQKSPYSSVGMSVRLKI